LSLRRVFLNICLSRDRAHANTENLLLDRIVQITRQAIALFHRYCLTGLLLQLRAIFVDDASLSSHKNLSRRSPSFDGEEDATFAGSRGRTIFSILKSVHMYSTRCKTLRNEEQT